MKPIKTIDEVQKECIGSVYTTSEFKRYVEWGGFNCFDGCGVYHDGFNETHFNVWDWGGRFNYMPEYPYVCWYNK